MRLSLVTQIYEDFTDEVSVFIGPDNERRFFQMDRFHGNRNLGWWRGDRCDSVYGGTEGVSYHQGVRKEDELRYFRKTLCRVMPLYYAREPLSCTNPHSAPGEISRYRDIGLVDVDEVDLSIWWRAGRAGAPRLRPGLLPRPRLTPTTSLLPNSFYFSQKF